MVIVEAVVCGFVVCMRLKYIARCFSVFIYGGQYDLDTFQYKIQSLNKPSESTGRESKLSQQQLKILCKVVFIGKKSYSITL